MMFGLQGRRALVTGAAGGIGAAIARAFMAAGAQVCGADAREGSFGHLAIRADLSQVQDCTDMVQQAVTYLGGLDIFIHAAGVEGPIGAPDVLDGAAYMRAFDINLHAATWALGAALPHMRARTATAGAKGRGAAVVLISSIAGARGNGAIGTYGMTKAALGQMVRNLAVTEGKHGIRANAIAPGLIATPFAAGLMAQPDFMARRLAATPLRRVGRPEEVAATAQWLASDAGGFVTGQTIVVDGGTLISDGS